MIYLASQSPRRKALLQQIGVSFQQLNCAIDESLLPDELACDYVLRMAVEKSKSGWNTILNKDLPVYPLLAADTSVVLDNRVLGKPENPEHACDMLMGLSGKSHTVMTAVAVTDGTVTKTDVSVSQVKLATLSKSQISHYVSTGEPLDKAGSYAIQGLGGAFVEHMSGSYTGVVGLPLHITAELLKSVGVSFWQNS